MHLVDHLNPMQKEGVLQSKGPVLLLAGAGSGKTRVLTHRIAYLIEQGVAPWNIMAITFTNKASKEMRERVDALVGQGSEDIWVSTFHSSCVRILRRDIEKIGYDKNFVIYDMDDQEKVMRECLKELDFNEKLFTPKGVMGEISAQKNELISVGEYTKRAAIDFRMSQIAKIYALYQKKLHSNNALDFDDLIFKTVELFTLRPDVLTVYQEKFRYIMVDEYQDTNTAQYQLVKLLASKYQNLCVVGDDDQSIYGWRGANIRNILDFEKDFKNTKVIKLEQNYRSTKTILEAANAVIQNNISRKPKALWTENEEGKSIRIFKGMNEYEEAQYAAEEIVRQVEEEGREYKDFAILYRTNAQSRVLEEHLLRKTIPYRLLGGVRFYERKEIKDIMSYLKAIYNPADDIAVKRIINIPKRGIGDTTIDKVMKQAAATESNFFDVLTYSDEIPDLQRSAKKLKEFSKMLITLQVRVETMSVVDLIEEILNITGYVRELELENTEEARGRIDNIKELISKAADYKKRVDEPSLTGFLEEVSLVADIDNYQENANSIVLMTLHSAKGLEFPYVFMTGLEEGIFPSYRSMTSGEEKDVEEERRLCYVGITRAREVLYITHAQSRMLRGMTQYNSPSRFIREIPEHFVEETKKPVVEKSVPKANTTTRKALPVQARKFVQNANTFTMPTPKNVVLNFGQGDAVQHKKFGVGTVQAIQPAGADYEVTVFFPQYGAKKLMAQFSNLKSV